MADKDNMDNMTMDTQTHEENKRLIQHEIHNEMKNSYIDYAMSVIASGRTRRSQAGTQTYPLRDERPGHHPGQTL